MVSVMWVGFHPGDDDGKDIDVVALDLLANFGSLTASSDVSRLRSLRHADEAVLARVLEVNCSTLIEPRSPATYI